MNDDFTLFIGTIGNGLQISTDRGITWRSADGSGVGGLEGNVRAIAVDPSDPQRVVVGSDRFGLYKSTDGGESFSALSSPTEGMEIWSIAIDYANPERIYVGTRPEGFRTLDDGKSWQQLPMGVDPKAMLYPPRTTTILVDPRDTNAIWAATEVNGIYRSENQGTSWDRLKDIGPSIWHQDCHCLAIRNGTTPAIYVSGPVGLATSLDDGDTWEIQPLPPIRDETGQIFKVGKGTPEHAYCRGFLIDGNDPGVIHVGTGNTIPGEIGAIQRSRDGGQHWEQIRLPEIPNSTIYWLADHPDVPDLLVAVSIFGYVYLSEDHGVNWTKLRKEFGHIRSVAVVPH